MKSLITCALAIATLFAASNASASHPRCRTIRGVINDVQVTDGCTSPNRFCAAGTVDGNRNFRGTTYFVMDGAVRGPTTAPGTLATSGLLTYTLDGGTLVVREWDVGLRARRRQILYGVPAGRIRHRPLCRRERSLLCARPGAARSLRSRDRRRALHAVIESTHGLHDGALPATGSARYER